MFNTNTNADNVTDKIMSNNKQSSIEYYIVNLINILGDEICNKISIEQNNKIVILEKQAKAMHSLS